MSTSLDDRSDLPPPPGLFDLGLVDEQEAGVEPIAGGLDDAEAERRWWNRAPKADPSAPVPPLTPRAKLFQGVLVLVFILSVSLLVDLLFVSSLQQRAAQQRLFDDFREQLAEGTAPVGPTDDTKEPGEDGRKTALAPGTPVAYLEIPAVGVRQVIVEGTSSSVLFDGPGHRRDSPLPGQVGTSIVMGRRATFGAPFARIGDLRQGDVIRAVTGQGTFDYEVMGVRREGDPVPEPAAADEGRLLLATADGRPYFPEGVLRVDAQITSTAVGAPARIVTAANLPAPEVFMASDTTSLYALVLWLQALIAVVIGAIWAWYRWGRARTWVVFLPLLLVVGFTVANEAAKLLPNLL